MKKSDIGEDKFCSYGDLTIMKSAPKSFLPNEVFSFNSFGSFLDSKIEKLQLILYVDND